MKKTRYTEEQIVFALKQAETGTRVGEVCRKMGISEATFYNWKKKFAGPGVTELRRLRQLEDEISVRRGCWLLMQSRTVYHWQSRRDDRAITLRIREIAEPGYATVARVFIFSCAGRDGLLTTRKPTGFIVRKA